MKWIVQDDSQISHRAELQSGTSSYFGQETIQHSVRFARLRELEARKDVGDVIYVVRGLRK